MLDNTECETDAPVGTALIYQAMDRQEPSQTHVATEFPPTVENPAPAQGFVAPGSYRAPAADPKAAAPKKGGLPILPSSELSTSFFLLRSARCWPSPL